ncbi:MAG: glycosyltransferase family 9 protein [Candidatus Latescibacteria bacterium]|nr:glycosyltransferase family 9 protein [Candidatus Latescibacterota bacterium]
MPMNILIIQTAFIGDVVLTTPLIRATKTAFPNVRVSILVIPFTADVLGNNPYLDEIIRYDKKGEDRGLSDFLRLARALKARSFDVALLPHRSLRSAALARIARIPRRIGFDLSPASFLYTDVVPYRHDAHEVERNLDLLHALGIEPEPIAPQIFPDEGDYENADAQLDCGLKTHRKDAKNAKNFKTSALPFPASSATPRCKNPKSEIRNPKWKKGWAVGVAPGSIWPTKRWPLESFAQVTDRLMKIGVQVILIGGVSDRALCDEIARKTAHAPLVAAGRLTLRESAALLARCDLLLSNDSAPVHIAAAMGTPVVALFGPTTPNLGFAPYGSGHTVLEVPLDCRPCGKHGGKRCPKRHFRCMKNLASERVFGVIMAKLERTKKGY